MTADLPLNTPQPFLGRRAKPDPRDRRFALRRQVSARTHRNWLVPGPVLDQGNTPQCVAYCAVHYLRAHPVVNSKGLPDPAALYRDAQLRDEWPGEAYDGTSARGACKALQEQGFLDGYGWAWDVPTLVSWVKERSPVMLGTTWHWDMFEPDRFGYLWPTGLPVGGHEYLVTGCNDRRVNPDGSLGALRIQNSWGPTWGQGGRAWLTYRAAQQLLDDYGDACTPYERKRA